MDSVKEALLEDIPPWAVNDIKQFVMQLKERKNSARTIASSFFNQLSSLNICNFEQIKPLHIKNFKDNFLGSRNHQYLFSQLIRYLIKRKKLDVTLELCLSGNNTALIPKNSQLDNLVLNHAESPNGINAKKLLSLMPELEIAAKKLSLPWLSHRSIFTMIIKRLVLFIYEYDLCFSLSIAEKWIDLIKDLIRPRQTIPAHYYAAKFIDGYIKGRPPEGKELSEYYFLKFSQNILNSYLSKLLPWLSPLVKDFLIERKNQGLSNEDAIKPQIVKFNSFLKSEGITSFDELTPEFLKKFLLLCRKDLIAVPSAPLLSAVRSFIQYCCTKRVIEVDSYLALFEGRSLKWVKAQLPKWLSPQDAIIDYHNKKFTYFWNDVEDNLSTDFIEVMNEVLSTQPVERRKKDRCYILEFFHFLDVLHIELKSLKPSILFYYINSHSNISCLRSVIIKLLQKFASKGTIPKTLNLAFNANCAKKFFYIDLKKAKSLPEGTLSCDQFIDLWPKILKELEKFNYSKTVKSSCNFACTRLAIFMCEYDLKFSYELGVYLLEKEREVLNKAYTKSSHMLCYFIANCLIREEPLTLTKLESYYKSCKAQPKKTYDSEFQELINEFLKYRKEQEGVAKSTLTMDRRAVYRLTDFLIYKRCSSFKDISPDFLYEFSSFDKHKTNAGLKAYLIRIVKFLYFLAQKQVIPYHFVLALSTKTLGDPQKSVSVLTEEQQSALHQYLTLNRHDILYLRNSLVLLLAYEFAMRFSDIADLCYENFNLRTMVLTKKQVKTGKTHSWPLTVSVVNRLLEYHKAVKIRSKDHKIFTSLYAPYLPVERRGLFKSLIEDLQNSGCIKFSAHDLRRTKASKLLENDVDFNLIAQLLGHSNSDHLKPYLNIDPNKMSCCVMPFNGFEYKGGVLL